MDLFVSSFLRWFNSDQAIGSTLAIIFIVVVLLVHFFRPKLSRNFIARRKNYNRNYKSRPYLVRRQNRQKDTRAYETNQLEAISLVSFEKVPLMNKAEYGVFKILEGLINGSKGKYRLMAQVSMGEIIRPMNGSNTKEVRDSAYFAINSKRLDFAIIDCFGRVALAIEYQGHGHFHSRSFMRDAVKREALRKASISFIEVPAKYNVDKLVANVREVLGFTIREKYQINKER